MQVEMPDQGTGAPKRPTPPPNWVAVLTDVKKAAVAGGSSALIPGSQTRLAMCASERTISPEILICQLNPES